jgi:hypothetical protein
MSWVFGFNFRLCPSSYDGTKQPGQKALQVMIKFLAGSCLSELGIVLKEPKTILFLDEIAY